MAKRERSSDPDYDAGWMNVLEYQNPAAPRMTVTVKRVTHDVTEIRVFYPRDLNRIPWWLFGWTVLALLSTVLPLLGDRYEWSDVVIIVAMWLFVYIEYQNWLNIRSAHRWVASPDGVGMERISPGGYRRTRFVRPENISSIRVVGEPRRKLVIWTRHRPLPMIAFHRVSERDLQSIAVALRDKYHL